MPTGRPACNLGLLETLKKTPALEPIFGGIETGHHLRQKVAQIAFGFFPLYIAFCELVWIALVIEFLIKLLFAIALLQPSLEP